MDKQKKKKVKIYISVKIITLFDLTIIVQSETKRRTLFLELFLELV
jgi:hypothetical protein